MTAPTARTRRSGVLTLLAALALLAVLPADANAPHQAEPPRKIEIQARPIEGFDVRDPARRRFGALDYIGGLELTSPDKAFGELSALQISADGAHFLSVSDKGRWFRGRIVYRDGVPVGIADAETAPILGPDGGALADRGWFDTESLAQDNGTLYVGIERVNQIVRFDYGRHGLTARGEPIELPAPLRNLPFNRGLETLVAAPRTLPRNAALAGALIAISERGLDEARNIVGYIIGGARPGAFAVKRTGEFDITDAAMLPDGDLLILERFFSPLRGVAMRIRRIDVTTVKPGALLDGPVLMEADMGYQIDNMEGLAAHRNANGEVVLTLISDDNFNVIQRTILLQFRMTAP